MDSYLSSFCSYLMKILAMLQLDPALLRPLQDHQRGATRIPRKAVGSSRVQNGKCNGVQTFDQLGCVVLPWLPVIHLPGPRKRAEIRPGWREIGTLGGSGGKASRTGDPLPMVLNSVSIISVISAISHLVEAQSRSATTPGDWPVAIENRSPELQVTHSDKSSLSVETPDRKWSPAKYRQGYGKWLQIVQTAPRWPWKSWKRRVYLKACPQ